MTIVLKPIVILAVSGALVACGPQPTRPVDTGSADIEGLQQVQARHATAAFLRPGVDFSHYDGVIVNDVQLAFRTPDRSQNQFPVDQESKARFSDYLKAQFLNEFNSLQNIQMVEAPGPNVLDLHVRVQDILATIPGRRVGAMGRASFALEAVAEVTLVLELRDSESEEVLVRVFDQRAVEGVAMFQNHEPVARWPDIEVLCQRWAARARDGLDRLVTGSY
jgi:hypothetical protein